MRVFIPKVSPILKLTISFGFLGILFFRHDVVALLTNIGQTDIALFGIGLLLSSLTVSTRAYKWQLLLQIQGMRIPLGTMHSLSYMALFFNNFFLGSIGGDAFKIYRTQGYSSTKSGAVVAILAERVTGIIILFLIALVYFLFLLFSDINTISGMSYYLLPVLSVLILGFLGINRKTYQKLLYLKNRLPFLEKIFDVLVYNIDIHRAHIALLSLCIILSLLYYVISIFSMYFYCLSLDAHIGILDLAFIVPLTMLITMIPISINGIGVQEGTFVLYFQRLGIESSVALTIALLPRIGSYIFSMIGGIIYCIDIAKARKKKSGCE